MSEVLCTELLRDSSVYAAGCLPREALDVSSRCFQGPASLLDLKMGTTLLMRSFSEAFKVLTGLGAAPWLHQALTGFEAPGDSSLRDFLFSAVVSFPLLALSFERPL